MPWQPPERSPLVPLLLNNLLQQRSQEQSDAARAAERAKLAAQERDQQIMQTAIESGAKGKDLLNLGPILSSTQPATLTAYASLADLRAKALAEKKREAEALDPAQLRVLGQTGARRPDASGRLVPPPIAAQQAYQAGLRERAMAVTDPRDVTSLVQQTEQFAGEAEAAAQEGISTERRAEATNIRSEGRADFRAKRDALINAEASALSYSRNGIVSIEDTIEASTARLRKAGLSDAHARSAALEADHIARGLTPKITADVESAQGKRDEVQVAQDLEAIYAKQYPELVKDPDFKRYVRLEVADKAVFNRHAAMLGEPSFMLTPSPGEAKRVKAQIEGRIDADNMLQILDGNYSQLEAAQKDPRNAGKFLGGPGQGAPLFDFLSTVGQEEPLVAATRAAVNRYLLAEVKATSGAKASDLDTAKTLLLLPSPSEYGTRGGKAKMDQLKQVHAFRATASMSPNEKAAIKRINDKYKNQTSKLNSLSAIAADEIERTGEISKETNDAIIKEGARLEKTGIQNQIRRDLVDAGIITESGESTATGGWDKY